MRQLRPCLPTARLATAQWSDFGTSWSAALLRYYRSFIASGRASGDGVPHMLGPPCPTILLSTQELNIPEQGDAAPYARDRNTRPSIFRLKSHGNPPHAQTVIWSRGFA